MTSSIRYLVVVGRTRPERRLMIIRPRPSAIRLRCAQMRARASSQAPAVNAFFGVFGGAPAAAEPLGVRSGWATERLYDGFGRCLPDRAGWAGRAGRGGRAGRAGWAGGVGTCGRRSANSALREGPTLTWHPSKAEVLEGGDVGYTTGFSERRAPVNLELRT